MIQGGGFDKDMKEKTEGQRGMIKNESGNGLSNVRGTIAMARTSNPNSAQNQFFINVEDNERLDTTRGRLCRLRQGDRRHGRGRQDPQGQGHERMGQVGNDEVPMENVPVEPVIIKSAKRKDKE